MVKKKKTSKKNTKSNSNFNRNLLIGVAVVILLFIFAYNFGEYDQISEDGLGSMMRDDDKGYCKKDTNKPKPCFFQKGESFEHKCCEENQFCATSDGISRCEPAHKTACEKGGILCSKSDEFCCEGTCFEEPGRNGKGICCKEDKYATYNGDGKLICKPLSQNPEDFLGTVGRLLRKGGDIPGTGR